MPTEAEIAEEVASRAALWERFKRGEWAGAPVPVFGEKLVLEPRYPYPGLNGLMLGAAETEQEADSKDEATIRNQWWSHAKHGQVVIVEEHGKIGYGILPGGAGARHELALRVLGCSDAWTVEAEYRAQENLVGHLKPHAAKHYLLTSMFLETSKRSGVTYLFRRSRPTLALRPHGDQMRLLCGLCLHPLGYYAGTFGGVMAPSDEVLAHLLLMRGDEHGYWKHANQHPPYVPECGI